MGRLGMIMMITVILMMHRPGGAHAGTCWQLYNQRSGHHLLLSTTKQHTLKGRAPLGISANLLDNLRSIFTAVIAVGTLSFIIHASLFPVHVLLLLVLFASCTCQPQSTTPNLVVGRAIQETSFHNYPVTNRGWAAFLALLWWRPHEMLLLVLLVRVAALVANAVFAMPSTFCLF